jgi:hypothetical protein
MDEQDWLAERLEDHRSQLQAVADRMLGSSSEADDAAKPALVNGTVGLVWMQRGLPQVVFDLTIVGGRIVTADLVADPRQSKASSSRYSPTDYDSAARRNTRIDRAVRTAANPATTARLRTAIAVALLIPQMSRKPSPSRSTSP